MTDTPEDAFMRQPEVKILRPVKIFLGRKGELSPDSWFEQNKLQILKVFQMSDPSFSRMVVANMIMEAWNSAAFSDQFEQKEGVTESDRSFLISWLQHYASILGVLTYEEIFELREAAQNFERSIGAAQCIDHLPQRFVRRIFKDHPEAYDIEAMKETIRELKSQEKVIGIFHGSFDPPHIGHLICLLYFHQYCDFLLWAIDSDSYIQNVKAPLRDPMRIGFNEHERLSIIKHFPYQDGQTVLPFNDLEHLQRGIVDFYKDMGIDIVFFSKVGTQEDLFKRRCRQVIEAGAIPFTSHPLTDLRFFSSTSLMQALKEGLAIDVNLPF